MMNESMYDDGQAAPPAQPDQGPPPEEKEQGEQGKTAVINSDLCPGMEVGDQITLRITGVQEGEYVVQYEGGEDQKEQAPPEGGGAGEPAPAEAPAGAGNYD